MTFTDTGPTGHYELIGMPKRQCQHDNDAGEMTCTIGADWKLLDTHGELLGVFCYNHGMAAQLFLNRRLEQELRQASIAKQAAEARLDD